MSPATCLLRASVRTARGRSAPRTMPIRSGIHVWRCSSEAGAPDVGRMAPLQPPPKTSSETSQVVPSNSGVVENFHSAIDTSELSSVGHVMRQYP
jgi:hypothetical protein